MFKVCRDCGLHLEADQFQHDRTTADGLSIYCRRCKSARMAAYYEANKAKILARTKKWRAEHRDVILKAERKRMAERKAQQGSNHDHTQ